jgi:RNA-directed DNA polymerase
MIRDNEPGPLIKQICATPNMVAAWRAVRGNIPARRRAHSRGVDEVSVAAFEQQWEANLEELSHSMLEDRYQPLPPRRREIGKPSGGKRTIGVLAVRDRVAQRAAYQVLEPLFEEQFLDCSYGFRPGRSVEDAIHRVLCYRQAGCEWVFDADVVACFDTLDHKLLMRFVSETVRERAVLKLLEAWLDAGVLETDAEVYRIPGAWERLLDGLTNRLGSPSSGALSRWTGEEEEIAERLSWDDGWRRKELLRQLGTDALLAGLAVTRPLLTKTLPGLRRLMRRKHVIWGTAGLTSVATLAGAWLLLQRLAPRTRGALQGSALSPLLANAYLHHFDRAMTDAGQNLVRFADDFLLCCPTREAAERAGELTARELAALRLRLNPAKSRVVSFAQGFHFLGHRFGDNRSRLPRLRRDGQRRRRIER